MTLDRGNTEGDEQRIVSATGGAKAQKACRPDLIPVEFLEALATHYGVGARKYDDDNWRRGYGWRLSIAAMMRHVFEFLRGHDEIVETFTDRETGEEVELRFHPLIAVAWHCATLYWFGLHRREYDDRVRS